jgi:hypothetical protein
LLALLAALPAGAVVAACGGTDAPGIPLLSSSEEETSTPVPPTATPEPPFIVAEGEQELTLMTGSPQQTQLYVFGTGRLGPIVMALGGVHGNEPGGWLAAERIVDRIRPQTGALLVIPRANRQATNLFARTTDELGDLNRAYPGRRGGLPMEQMALEIIETLRAYHVNLVIDMHESWSFYRDRTDTNTGTAWLGQTMSSSSEPGIGIARHLVDAQNARMQRSLEEFTLRDWPPRNANFATAVPGSFSGPTPEPGTSGQGAVFGGSRSSLGLPTHVPGLSAILVEMGQQQTLERRTQMHVEIVQEALTHLGA